MNLTIKQKAFAYIQLTRFDKPVGIELLLWATLWGVFLAAVGQTQASTGQVGLPPLVVVFAFTMGAILMRAAGCAINDFADRKVDAHVTRTRGRPLADGRLTGKEAVAAFLVLTLASSSLLLLLPVAVFYWSFAAVALAFIYPFMKRFTHLPQVFLAAAFGWSIPMGYVAVQGHTDVWCWLIFAAYMCWTVAYDTQYAMADKADDVKIGVKSTAILFERLFGQYDILAIVGLQLLFLLLMGVVLGHYFIATSLSVLPVFGLLPVLAMFFWQYKRCQTRQATQCFNAFLANIWVGRYIFMLVLLSIVGSMII